MCLLHASLYMSYSRDESVKRYNNGKMPDVMSNPFRLTTLHCKLLLCLRILRVDIHPVCTPSITSPIESIDISSLAEMTHPTVSIFHKDLHYTSSVSSDLF